MANIDRRVRATRLVFAFDDAGIRLAGSTARGKPAPRGMNPRSAPPENAIIIELRSSDGSVLHRQVLPDPIPQTVEYFENGKPRRSRRAPAAGGFTAVLPVMDQAVEVVIEAGADIELSQPAFARAPEAVRGRRELARFSVGGQ